MKIFQIKFGRLLARADFEFHDDDIFIRRMLPNRRNSSGRPTRGAFQGRDSETSVYLKRILRGRQVPTRNRGDDLAEFSVKWLFDISLTKTPLKVVKDRGAHFIIKGRLSIEFKDFLRDNSVIIRSIDLD